MSDADIDDASNYNTVRFQRASINRQPKSKANIHGFVFVVCCRSNVVKVETVLRESLEHPQKSTVSRVHGEGPIYLNVSSQPNRNLHVDIDIHLRFTPSKHQYRYAPGSGSGSGLQGMFTCHLQ